MYTIEDGSARIRSADEGTEERGTRNEERIARSLARSLALRRVTLRCGAGRCASAYAPRAMVGRGGASHVTRPANQSRA